MGLGCHLDGECRSSSLLTRSLLMYPFKCKTVSDTQRCVQYRVACDCNTFRDGSFCGVNVYFFGNLCHFASAWCSKIKDPKRELRYRSLILQFCISPSIFKVTHALCFALLWCLGNICWIPEDLLV